MRPSRKGWGSDFMLPGMVPENTIEAAIAMDMSGSISNDMGRDMLSEVKGIMEQFQDFRCRRRIGRYSSTIQMKKRLYLFFSNFTI